MNRSSVSANNGLRRIAVRFVLTIGILSFFADFTYEGSRSLIGPFLGTLGATGTIVGIVVGFGEFLGYGLRLVSGRWADASGKYWPITICGYVVQMLSVPSLALADNWPAAAALIILERVGKAIRNPPRDVMLSHAGKQAGGYGLVFGLHEALDQSGAMCGPLLVAFVLAHRGSYHQAFAVLLVPALLNLVLVLTARLLYPRPQDMEPGTRPIDSHGLPRVYWIYLAGAALVAAGFADYPLIAYHFQQTGTVPGDWVAILYSIAMAVSGTGSLVLGRMFDRWGFVVLIMLTIITAAFAPLVFFGGFWLALVGAAVWGIGMGVHESMIPAAVSTMVSGERRASAFGLFTAGYGTAWFLGSAVIGVLYGVSLIATVAFCVVSALAAAPIFIVVRQMQNRSST